MDIYKVRQLLKEQSIFDIPLRVVYYVRVSTDKEEQKNSTVNQDTFFEDLIASHPAWTFVGKYIDDGASGIMADKREDFQRMISDGQNKMYDLILTKEISRFARNTLDSIRYTRLLLNCGVGVWFYTDNVNTINEDAELHLAILSSIAQNESLKTSTRVRMGHAQSIKRGVVMGNSMLYGYNKDHGKLVIDPYEAEMVRSIYEKYATGVYTTPMLEREIYASGYRNHYGEKISRTVIGHIITNPKYKGYYVGGKVKIIDMFTKKRKFIPKDEWIMYKDETGERVPAIIDEETWELANKYFVERGDAIKARRKVCTTPNTFTGKIYCGTDGAPYWLKHRVLRGKDDSTWYCSDKLKNGTDSCKSFPIKEDEIRSMVVDLITLSPSDIQKYCEMYLEMLRKSIDSSVDKSAKIAELNKEIENNMAKKQKLLDYNLQGILSDDEFISNTKLLNRKIERAQSLIDSFTSKSPVELKSNSILDKAAKLLNDFSGVKSEDLDNKIVDELIDKIVITPQDTDYASVEFYLKTSEKVHKTYDRKAVLRNDNLLNIMLPVRSTVFYRHPRHLYGHETEIRYDYRLVI